MPVDPTCLNSYPPLPLIPIIANGSQTFTHSSYKPSSGGLAQAISSSIIDSIFSINDVRSLLETVANKASDSWNDVSNISETKPIPSIIIYSSIALTLFLILSLAFCVLSCLNCSKRISHGSKRQKSKTTQVCVCLLVIVYLLGIGDMIYVAYRVNKSKVSIDETIKEVNQDIYPKEISEHLMYLVEEIEHLDQYCVQSDSILINASKTMLVKTFNQILNEKYLIQGIIRALNHIDTNIQDLNSIVDSQSSISPFAKEIYQRAKEQYQNMIDSLQIPLQEICNYANGTQTDTDKQLRDALDIIHQKLRKVNNTINEDILQKITPWQNHKLMNGELEEQIRRYTSLIGTVFLIFVILLAIIPLSFAVFILLSCLCRRDQRISSDNDHGCIRMNTVSNISSRNSYSGSRDRSSQKSRHRHSQDKRYESDEFEDSSKRSCRMLLCLMRVGFFVMILILIIMATVSGVYYALDLVLQGTCRAVHDDQPFLVSFITNKVITTNTLFINGSDLNTTILNIINDCRNEVHFTRRLLDSYWSSLDRHIGDMMNELNKRIYDQFQKSTAQIDIPDEMNLLNQFANQTNITEISNKVLQINSNLNVIETILLNISAGGPTLPQSFVQTTITEFNAYMKQVLESTLDSCPLPMAIMYKADTLICHNLGDSLSGLWLSVFLYMFLITVGLCIFGVLVYKRLN